MKLKFAKYFKDSCRWSSDEQFSFKCFLNIAFVRKISPKLSGSFGCYRHKWVKTDLAIEIEAILYFQSAPPTF